MSYVPNTEKRARLSCRINPMVKEKAETAARYRNQSITDFTEAALEEKANAVIAENERILLSEHDFQLFLAAIADENEMPTPEMLAAAAEYRQHKPLTKRKL